MRMYDIILKKRDGQELSKDEIDFFVSEYTSGNIPDYQASALLMAIFINKMSIRETVDLTYALMNSGDIVNLDKIKGIVVDKHSTGGVGDTTTLIALPMVAACNVPVAKMSGRGLGHTGGTLDKLESIDGFNITLSPSEFIDIVNKNKIAVVGQTANIAPADKKIYALRDVTATVDSISLIAASVMSKKLAAGADAIVLDVKCGSGAFAKNIKDAKKLAKIMVDIGTNMGRKVVAIITDMSQPLGIAIGNSLEVKEAVDVLTQHGADDITELCLILSSYMVSMGKKISIDDARALVEKNWKSGLAYDKFRDFIKAQGGNLAVIDHYVMKKNNQLSTDKHFVKDGTDYFNASKYVYEIRAIRTGYISAMRSDEIGNCAMMLGAGREKKDDIIDRNAGIILYKKLGDMVIKDKVIARFYTDKFSSKEQISSIENRFLHAMDISDNKVQPSKLILDIITNMDGVE